MTNQLIFNINFFGIAHSYDANYYLIEIRENFMRGNGNFEFDKFQKEKGMFGAAILEDLKTRAKEYPFIRALLRSYRIK